MHLSRRTAVWGTLFYLAPEMTSINSNHDFKCDVWSLGIITYEMLSQKVPFQKATEQETLQAIVEDDIDYSMFDSTEIVRFLKRVSLLSLF